MRKLTEHLFALTLGVVLVLGQLGASTHGYVHLGDLTPDLACHHCIAGDAKPPITVYYPSPDRHHHSLHYPRPDGTAQVTNPSHPGHPVRAPPAFT